MAAERERLGQKRGRVSHMYPRIRRDADLGTFTYNLFPGTHYYVQNRDGDEYEISEDVFQALKHADGLHDLAEEGILQETLDKLEGFKIITKHRYMPGGVSSSFALFVVDAARLRNLWLFHILNFLLPGISIITMLVGIILWFQHGDVIDGNVNLLVFYIGIAISAFLHEVGHLIAAVSYGSKSMEVGISLMWFIPTGAYVTHDKLETRSVKERIQVSMAGLETNCLLVGIIFILRVLLDSLPETLLWIGLVNVALVFYNLLPLFGSDGEKLLEELLGVKNYRKAAKKAVLVKDNRLKLIHSGFKGKLCFVLFALRYVAVGMYVAVIAVMCVQICILIRGFSMY